MLMATVVLERTAVGSAYRRRIILPFLHAMASEGVQRRHSPGIRREPPSESEASAALGGGGRRRQTSAISWRRNEPEQGRVVAR